MLPSAFYMTSNLLQKREMGARNGTSPPGSKRRSHPHLLLLLSVSLPRRSRSSGSRSLTPQWIYSHAYFLCSLSFQYSNWLCIINHGVTLLYQRTPSHPGPSQLHLFCLSILTKLLSRFSAFTYSLINVQWALTPSLLNPPILHALGAFFITLPHSTDCPILLEMLS